MKFLITAYGAAGISFLASLLRDYAVIKFTQQAAEFFQLLYVVSMAASFGVNAIILGSGSLGKRALIILLLLGSAVILFMLPPGSAALSVYVGLIFILFLWMSGARWSRDLIEQGWIFLGRIREAVSSVALVGLVFVGIDIRLSFLIAVAAGTVFAWFAWRLVKKRGIRSAKSAVESYVDVLMLARSIVLTNMATFSITYWAFVQTARAGQVFGVDNAAAIRFSMYFYQVLTIGAVILVTRGFEFPLAKLHMKWLLLMPLLGFVSALFLPLQSAIVAVPIFAGALHYGMVVFLQDPTKRRSQIQ